MPIRRPSKEAAVRIQSYRSLFIHLSQPTAFVIAAPICTYCLSSLQASVTVHSTKDRIPAPPWRSTSPLRLRGGKKDAMPHAGSGRDQSRGGTAQATGVWYRRQRTHRTAPRLAPPRAPHRSTQRARRNQTTAPPHVHTDIRTALLRSKTLLPKTESAQEHALSNPPPAADVVIPLQIPLLPDKNSQALHLCRINLHHTISLSLSYLP